MTPPFFDMTADLRAQISIDLTLHEARDISIARARSWTGRSVVSQATDTILSRISTSGFYRTRVSALRGAGPRHSRIGIGAGTSRDSALSYLQAAAG